jgi:hypothetical protein
LDCLRIKKKRISFQSELNYSFARNFLRAFKDGVQSNCNLQESESKPAKGGINLIVLANAVVSVLQEQESPVQSAETRSYCVFFFCL